MIKNIKDRLLGLLCDFMLNLIDAFLERREREVFHKQFGRPRKPEEAIRFDFHGHFFWANLRGDEILVDFSKIQHGLDCVFVPMRKGQHLLERKVIKLGRSPETSLLVLEGTTIGAQESWWQKKKDKGELSFKLDADI